MVDKDQYEAYRLKKSVFIKKTIDLYKNSILRSNAANRVSIFCAEVFL